MNEKFLPKLEVRSKSKSTATVYRYIFVECSGWAHFTICDDTGEFSIQSDWGNWNYRWNIDALPDDVTLTSFIARGSFEYLSDKLYYTKGGRNARFEFDREATVLKLRTAIEESIDLEDGERIDILKDLAELDALFQEGIIDGAGHRGLWNLDQFFGGDIYEMFVYVPTTEYLMLRDRLLPFFVNELRAQLVDRLRDKVASIVGVAP